MSEVALAQGKPFYPTINALSAELETLFAEGDFDGVLVRLQAFVQAVILDRRALAKVFADPVLDAWCQRIGAAVAAEVNANTDAAYAESRLCR